MKLDDLLAGEVFEYHNRILMVTAIIERYDDIDRVCFNLRECKLEKIKKSAIVKRFKKVEIYLHE